MKAKFRVGQEVIVLVRGLPRAKIVRSDGRGVMVLDREIQGCRYWNIAVLRKIGPRPRTKKAKGESR